MIFGYDVEFSQRDVQGNLAFPEQRRSKYFEVTRDGILNEMRAKENTLCSCREEIIANINCWKDWLYRLRRGKGIKTYINDVVYFKNDEWANFPRHFKELGCQPDECLYNERVSLSTWENIPMRTCGGHIHIGGFNSYIQRDPISFKEKRLYFNMWQDKPENMDLLQNAVWESFVNTQAKVLRNYKQFIRNMDALVTISNVIWNRRNEATRRQMYGTASRFRRKPYGIEYRSLDNSWILHNWSISLTFGLIKLVIELAEQYPEFQVAKNSELSEVRNVINKDLHVVAKDMYPEFIDRVNSIFSFGIEDSALGIYSDGLKKLHNYLYKNPITEKSKFSIKSKYYGIGEFYDQHSHRM